MSSASEIAMPDVSGRWCELKDRAVFLITGPDRVRFLNGQLTNDVAGPLSEKAIPACVCTLKGKTEALVWVSDFDGTLILDGELAQREPLFARLDRYLIADDCEIKDVTGDWKLIHHFDVEESGVKSMRSREPGRDLWLNSGESIPFPETGRISAEEFELAQLLSLVPMSGREITGEEFPAELGLDQWAVDFHKGCYLGQEIVSRIESVGRVNKSTRLVETAESLSRGDEILLDTGIKGRATRESLPSKDGKFLSLALCKVSPDQESRFQSHSATLVRADS